MRFAWAAGEVYRQSVDSRVCDPQVLIPKGNLVGSGGGEVKPLRSRAKVRLLGVCGVGFGLGWGSGWITRVRVRVRASFAVRLRVRVGVRVWVRVRNRLAHEPDVMGHDTKALVRPGPLPELLQ